MTRADEVAQRMRQRAAAASSERERAASAAWFRAMREHLKAGASPEAAHGAADAAARVALGNAQS